MMSKLEKLCIKWLNDNYGDLEQYKPEKYSDYIFHMKDGKCILEYDKKSGYVYVSYKEIWSFFESFFGMNYQQIQDLTKVWVEEQYKKEVTSTQKRNCTEVTSVEEQYKKEVTSTVVLSLVPVIPVEEHYKMGVTTTPTNFNFITLGVEKQYKKDVTTTFALQPSIQHLVEEHYKIN